jgi:putative FmdB family regulatory protein
MPTYEYACTQCGERLEAVQSFTDDALTVCPVCEGRLRKLFSPVGVVFKGSGFYKTDSRDKAKTGASKKSADSAGASSATSDSSASSGSGTSESAGSSAAASTASGSGGTGSGSSGSTGDGSKVA